MKMHPHSIFALLVGICLLAPSAFAFDTGKVIRIKGTAWQIYGRSRLKLLVGQKTRGGSLLKTEPGSELVITLGRDIASLIKGDSEVLINSKDGKDWTASLKKGAVLSSIVNPENRPNHFVFRSRSATMSVRGTTFFVEDWSNKPVFFCVCNGTVEVTARDGKTKATVVSKHHDHPVIVAEGDGTIESRLVPAPMGETHTDADVAELEKILGK